MTLYAQLLKLPFAIASLVAMLQVQTLWIILLITVQSETRPDWVLQLCLL